MATQGYIDFTPAARQLGAELARRDTLARAILELLRMGAARRSEMKDAGGDRFSARVNELRAEGYWIVGPVKAPRWGIHERTEPWPDGEDKYVLVEPRP